MKTSLRSFDRRWTQKMGQKDSTVNNHIFKYIYILHLFKNFSPFFLVGFQNAASFFYFFFEFKIVRVLLGAHFFLIAL